jgi:hypothetical protein
MSSPNMKSLRKMKTMPSDSFSKKKINQADNVFYLEIIMLFVNAS